MKVEMKNYVEYIIQKQWKPIVSVVRKILQAKIPVLERIKQNGLMLYQTALFVARKNQLSLKIKNYAILIKFQMIILRWIKSFPNFYWLETNLSELHSKQPGFTYSTWRPFPEDREEFKNLGKQVIWNIYIEMN